MAKQDNRNIKLPDAIHVVTAIKAGCLNVFAADKRFVVPHPLQAMRADAAGIAAIKTLLHA